MKLVRKDMRIVSQAMTKLCRWTAKKIGADLDVKFVFDKDYDETDKVLDTAERLKALGAEIDIEKVKQLVKYDICADKQQTIWTPESEE